MKASGKILSRKEESFNAESFIAWVEENLEQMPKPESAKIKSQEANLDENVSIEMPLLELDEFDSEKFRKNPMEVKVMFLQVQKPPFKMNQNPIKIYQVRQNLFTSRREYFLVGIMQTIYPSS